MTTYTDHTAADAIKQEVREHYGQFAANLETSGCCSSAASSCCGSSAKDACCSTAQPAYAGEALDALPQTAVASTRGCGNPIARAQLQPGHTVLDLGSGGGLDVLLAAQRVGPNGFVYGLDMTDEMLALARRNAEKAGVTNVTFLQGDIENIPLPDAQIDVIISNCVINLSPDKDTTLREAFRVLRPGGRLAISDIVIDGTLDDLPIAEAELRAALDWAGCIAGALTRQQYLDLLHAAGFADAQVQIDHRYSTADLLPDLPPALAGVAPELVNEIISRFTSSLVTARRPA